MVYRMREIHVTKSDKYVLPNQGNTCMTKPAVGGQGWTGQICHRPVNYTPGVRLPTNHWLLGSEKYKSAKIKEENCIQYFHSHIVLALTRTGKQVKSEGIIIIRSLGALQVPTSRGS